MEEHYQKLEAIKTLNNLLGSENWSQDEFGKHQRKATFSKEEQEKIKNKILKIVETL